MYNKLNYVYLNSFNNFSVNVKVFYSQKLSLLFLKGIFGVFIIYLPSFYYFKWTRTSIQFLFISHFFYRSFIQHIFNYYNYITCIFFVKLKIRGLGYRIRKLIDNLYYFFFNYTNFFYLYVPYNLIIKSYRKRCLLISFNWCLLKLVVSHILLLKKLGVYNLRGIRLVKQIRLLRKTSKKI